MKAGDVMMTGLYLNGCVIAFCFFMLYRNYRVYQFRMEVLGDESRPIEQRLERYRKLPEYNAMLFQLARFDWSDYLEGAAALESGDV